MIRRSKIICAVLCVLLISMISIAGCGSGPSGTYTATGLFGIERTVTFEGDTVEIQNVLGSKQVYKYEIRDNRSEIILTDVVSNKSEILSYKYIDDPPCVVIGNTAYYKK